MPGFLECRKSGYQLALAVVVIDLMALRILPRQRHTCMDCEQCTKVAIKGWTECRSYFHFETSEPPLFTE